MSAKKEQLIKVATALFAQRGFHPVGIDRIITESGVARMTLYKHFPGKEELIAAVLDRRHEDVMASLHRAVDRVGPARDRLRAIFEWHEAWFGVSDFSGCLFERALAEFGTDHPTISEVALRYRTAMTAWMREMLAELMPAEAAARTAAVFMILLDGAAVDARAFAIARSVWHAAEAIIEHEAAAAPKRKPRRRGRSN